MGETLADSWPASADGGEQASLCFVLDPDFGFLQAFSKSLRDLGVHTIELLNCARLAENVDDHHPEIVFIDLSPTSPYDCVRALLSLKECDFSGRVQLLGRCEIAFLENFRKVGSDLSLAMLPVLQKPIDVTAVRKIVVDQKLSCQLMPTPEFSLKSAIARDLITFWYQPKIDLRKRQVVGAEALARVSHPQHGIMSPAPFLAGAEEEDLMDLASRALVNALEMSATLDEMGICLQIAINVGVDTLVKLPIAELVSKHRPRNDQWPGLLFDVAETQVVNKITVLREKFHELEKYGISLGIDNFGRGHSSFAVFRYLPFAEIKIDASYVQGCADNRGNASVCKSMIQIAHNFSRSAAAVGIETSADAHELTGMGCDIGQGHLFGKPMTEQGLITMLMRGRRESKNFYKSSVWGVSAEHTG